MLDNDNQYLEFLTNRHYPYYDGADEVFIITASEDNNGPRNREEVDKLLFWNGKFIHVIGAYWYSCFLDKGGLEVYVA